MAPPKDHLIVPLRELELAVYEAFVRSGLGQEQARLVASRIATTEADGITTHGLALTLRGLEMIGAGKVNREALPHIVASGKAWVQVDCDGGFPDLGRAIASEAVWDAARTSGIAALSLVNAYSGGALGYHAEILSAGRFVTLGFASAPAAMAAWGGRKAILGTNPMALAVPADGETVMLIDQAATVVAKGIVTARAADGAQLEPGWAIDSEGHPTTSAADALKGTLAPAGGSKGVGMALLAEVFAAMLGGPNLGHDAPGLLDKTTGSPRLGSFFILVDAAAFGREGFESRLRRITALITEDEGARLPGERRLSVRKAALRDGVAVDADLLRRVRQWAVAGRPETPLTTAKD